MKTWQILALLTILTMLVVPLNNPAGAAAPANVMRSSVAVASWGPNRLDVF